MIQQLSSISQSNPSRSFAGKPSQGVAAPLPTEATGRGRNGQARGQLFWTVETSHGQVQGISNGVVKQFKGLPYAAPTAGGSRFAPPRPPEPWTGVRDCLGYGQIAPQVPLDPSWEYGALLHWDSHIGPGGMGEDCLNLNIWTPGVSDGGRRPVLVSFHGGGWLTGSSNGSMYDGARLARLGDVVVITVNHRLGALGFTDLASFDGSGEFSSAGVCGLLDLVAALKWVRENVEAFGGDPKRVLVFGHSGGGWKTSSLMAMPSASGLFQRAGVQSGTYLRHLMPDEGADRAERLLHALALPTRQAHELRNISWQRILAAQAEAGVDFRPVLDGRVLPRHPFDPDAPEESAEVPMIIGTTLHDWSNMFENFDADDAAVLEVFRKSWGARAELILAAYRDESPDETPFRLQGKAYTDAARGDAMVVAERKAARGRAAAYLYVWNWATDAYDGRYGAVHASDLDAAFHHHRSPMSGSGRSPGRTMSDRMAATWIAFARNGVPDNPLIPTWPAYERDRRATMVFDEPMRVAPDYRGEFVRLIGETGPATTTTG